jgi:DNA-binding CsgD family transcriptional regulator
VLSAIIELDRMADLCARLDFAGAESDLASRVLEPIAALVGAETASLRCFGLANGAPAPLAIVSVAIPSGVKEAYLDRYFDLDPIRRLVARRLAGPLFDDPARRGEWSGDDIGAARRAVYRDEFQRYRREFLLPNHFYHHLGFCVQNAAGGTTALDFHRPQRAPQFGALERARARVVAGYLHAKAGRERAGAAPRGDDSPDTALTGRETEVAAAVASGLSNKQVAESLGISVRTVENHLRSIFAKLDVGSRTALAAKLRSNSPAFS